MSSLETQGLLELILKATPLWERMDGTPCDDHCVNGSIAERRVRRWQVVMGGADPLARRLAPRSLRDMLPALAESSTPVVGSVIPEWAVTLRLVIAEARRSSLNSSVSANSTHRKRDDRPLPFEEVFAPFVAVARERLRNVASSRLSVLSPSAVIAFERQLLAHMSFVAHLVLAEDFSHFRFSRAPVAAFEAIWNQTETSTEIYNAYVAQCADLLELMRKRPVLARLLGQAVNQWVTDTANLCHRFADDFLLLKHTFQWDYTSADGAIGMVRTDLSDRHRNGQTVTELILKSGSRIIYKPRTVRPEQVFYEFLRRLTFEDLSLSLRILKVVDRGAYGWCEAAIPSACDSLEGIARFYRRAGMLLAVLHLLAVTDIHCENVVAAGEHPVVVDLETMLTAMVPGGRFAWSVLSTGLLPRWQTAPDGHHFDLSGLGADGTQDAGIQRRAWMRVNTDQMHLSDPVAVRASTNHCPAFAETRATARDYLRDITAGFEEMYAHLMVSRDKLINDGVLLAMFDDLELRTLLRSTATYTRLQLRLLHPEFMTSGIDRSIELEWLARPLTGPTSDKCDRQRIYDRERDAMEKLDVPSFTTSFADLVSHESADPDLAFLCARRNGSLVRERLGHLSVEDCCQQIEAIEQAMRDRYALPAAQSV